MVEVSAAVLTAMIEFGTTRNVSRKLVVLHKYGVAAQDASDEDENESTIHSTHMKGKTAMYWFFDPVHETT